jgi:hypothetical protein
VNVKKIIQIGLAAALGLVCLMGAVVAWLYWRTPAMVPPSSVKVDMSEGRIARGKFLFTVVANCDGCHSQLDTSRFGDVVVPGRIARARDRAACALKRVRASGPMGCF